LRNLIDNAERHARARIDVSVSLHPSVVELRVANDGPPIPPSELARVFVRFHRLDEARSSEAGGSGLGLAIVHELVRAHRGTVTAEPVAEGALFVVRFPCADGDLGPTGRPRP
jgi:signal transduction histidine kinase